MLSIAPDMSPDISQLVGLLEANGATHLTFESARLRDLTHLISTHADFEAYHDAVEGFIHVVRPHWVHHSIVRKRMTNPRQYSPDPAFFFADVIVTCAEDIPEGHRDAIYGGVTAMGGQWTQSMTKLVTHVVALSMDSPRCRLVQDRKLKCKLVLPHWFDACLILGKKIDSSPYELPDPKVYRTELPPPAGVWDHDIEGASQFTPEPLPTLNTPPGSPSNERRGLKVFKSKKIMLHDDLRLSEHLKASLANVIVRAGGKVVGNLDDATVLICKFRGSQEFVDASRAGKEVGNLTWLYYLINRNMWTAPTKRLLHYPFPENGIAGFDKYKISVSNYQGEARIYLESLVRAAGGQFTKTMGQENTHLITAYRQGEKSMAAVEWNVEIVNHLWLEESYAKEKVQTISNPRYTMFPTQTNLGEVVGQTEIDREAVEMRYFPFSSEDDESIIFLDGPSSQPPVPESNRRTNALKTPAKDRGDVERAPGSRQAKNRAVTKLHALASDIALYQKETKRVGGVVYGGRRVTDPDRIDLSSSGRKRSIEAVGMDDEDVTSSSEADDEAARGPSKKQRKHHAQAKAAHALPPLTVLATGVDDLQPMLSRLRSLDLNLKFTSNPHGKFDVLVTPRIQRTRKFLCGLAMGPTIVRSTWLNDMIKQGKRLPVADYILKNDQTMKAKLESVNLETSLQRARQNKSNGGLLRDWTILCTEKVGAGFDVYKDITTANGGTLLLFRGRESLVNRREQAAGKAATSRASRSRDADGDVGMHSDSTASETDSDGDDDGDAKENSHSQPEDTLYCITDPADKALWPKFEALAKAQGYRPRLVTPDWLCELALEQRLPSAWKQEWDVKRSQSKTPT